ncbi:MAG: hypothetical protein MUF64_06520 [Polyangiaceae bacterium]|jgi:hypothetical protein|nr:hypothetical protein [Polyangiaceae bacterium]
MSEFIEVEVEEGDGIEEPVLLRFKVVSSPRPVTRAQMDGGYGVTWWAIEAPGAEARAALVEDSSDGEALLLFGGERGLRVTSDREARRVPYLLLARGSSLEP